MAPKKPQRTPRIATGFDVNYTCTNNSCNWTGRVLNPASELDNKTWTCTGCGDPVLIEMDDRAGHKVDVRRYQAQYVEAGQMVYLHNDLKTAYFVKGSSPATSLKYAGQVMLGLANLAGVYFMQDEYVNCVP